MESIVLIGFLHFKKKNLHSLSSSTWNIFIFLSLSSFIFSSIWYASPLPQCFISLIEFFSSRISFFWISVSLVKYSCSLILSLSSFHCLSEYSCSLLNFFITAFVIYQLDHNSPRLCSVTRKLPFSFCDIILPWLWCLMKVPLLSISSSEYLSHLGKAWYILILTIHQFLSRVLSFIFQKMAL